MSHRCDPFVNVPDGRLGPETKDSEFESYLARTLTVELARELARFTFYAGYDTNEPLHLLSANQVEAVDAAVLAWEDQLKSFSTGE